MLNLLYIAVRCITVLYGFLQSSQGFVNFRVVGHVDKDADEDDEDEDVCKRSWRWCVMTERCCAVHERKSSNNN